MAQGKARRSVAAWSIATIFVAGQVLAVNPSTAAATMSNTENLIDLRGVTGTVTDPLGSYVAVDRNCKPGQVDVNTATAYQLTTGLSIPSEPTVSRVIELRPWQDVTHLVSVPGIGPERIPDLRRLACATPTQLPPTYLQGPTKGFHGIDLQTATVRQWMTLGFSGPVAASLAAVTEVPDNLGQLVAPAVPGFTQRDADRLMAHPNVAISPLPFTYQGKDWRWVTPEHGAVVTATNDERYALIVPPGAMVDSSWATTTPLPMEYGTVPTSDFHIYGTWVPEVAIRLPSMEGTTAATSYVYHEAADGPRLSSNKILAQGPNNTVLAPMGSLSIAATFGMPEPCKNLGKYYFEGDKLVYCDSHTSSDPNDINNLLMLRDSGAERALAWTAFQQSRYGGVPRQPCPPSDNQLVISSGTLHSMTCPNKPVVQDLAKFTWVNESGDFSHFGNVYQTVTNNGVMVGITRNFKGLVTDRAFNAISGDSSMIPPGDGLTVWAEQGQPAVDVSVATQGGRARALYWMAANITMPLDVIADISESTIVAVLSCVSKLIDNYKNSNAWADCAITAATAGLEVSARSGDKSAAAGIKILKWLGRGLAVVDYVATMVQGFVEAGWDTATHRFLNPPPPAPSGGINLDGRYVARVGYDAYLVSPTNDTGPEPGPIARRIRKIEDFNCYVTGYFVYDLREKIPNNTGLGYRINSPGLPLILTDRDAPSCTTMTPSWTYTPDSSIVVKVDQGQPVYGTGNVPPGIVVKMKDWKGNGSWYLTPTGEIVSIQSGLDYICMTNSLPVIYNFPFDATDGTPNIQTWEPIGYNKSVNCSSGTITVIQK